MASLMLTWITLGLCIVTFVRLFTYQRKGARFRRDVSIMATVVMMACITTCVEIVTGQLVVQPAAWPMIVIHAVMAVGLIRTRGNLAPVLRGG
ncbi:phage holin family protein [Azotobacter vinelandii]|uniref:phage holin family protein n=1 Tax=Azotobacter vinelandii TaxID=354 RepID=UPI000916119E|nr:phage holin family protein [Azotobacter vinelandii]SFY16545.1 Putative 3TM holin, Phage_holin_3 [Azotobacter vinelandii]